MADIKLDASCTERIGLVVYDDDPSDHDETLNADSMGGEDTLGAGTYDELELTTLSSVKACLDDSLRHHQLAILEQLRRVEDKVSQALEGHGSAERLGNRSGSIGSDHRSSRPPRSTAAVKFWHPRPTSQASEGSDAPAGTTKSEHSRSMRMLDSELFTSRGEKLKRKSKNGGEESVTVRSRSKSVMVTAKAAVNDALNELQVTNSQHEDDPPTRVPPLVICLAAMLRRFVRGTVFEIFSGLNTLTTLIMVTIEIESKGSSDHAYIGDVLFVLDAFFVTETILRMAGERSRYFLRASERTWNAMDMILVIFWVADFWGNVDSQLLRAIRAARMARTVRVIRMMRNFGEFRKMVFALLYSVRTLFWALILLGCVMYIFSIWFTSYCTDFIAIHGGESQNLVMFSYFGSLSRTFYTLWCSITSGVSWREPAAFLFEVHPMLPALFVAYVAFAVFGVTNIVTSIFVDSAMQSRNSSRDVLQQDRMKTKAMFRRHLSEIFSIIDTDQSGMISMDELKEFLTDESLELQDYLDALEINTEDAKALFKLLDIDEKGQVDLDEFCDGCLRLKGEAKSFDINCVLYTMKRLEKRLQKGLNSLETKIGTLQPTARAGKRRPPPVRLSRPLPSTTASTPKRPPTVVETSHEALLDDNRADDSDN